MTSIYPEKRLEIFFWPLLVRSLQKLAEKRQNLGFFWCADNPIKINREFGQAALVYSAGLCLGFLAGYLFTWLAAR